ncbi:MAG: cohesin domain-containing protein [Candidatus Liptonbacteria bacterium]|nr:cohesin domain-containing protein [Candidatus Liptonbacteria bacterium]
MYVKNHRFSFTFTVVVILFSTFYILHSYVAHAVSASVYFSAPEPAPALGGEFAVRVLVDSDQPVNAYVVRLNYDPGKLELLGSDNSRSIIDIAQGVPEISAVGSVSFKGGSSRPFEGTAGELLALRFRARENGLTELRFADAAFYLANGKGTKIIPTAPGAELSVGGEPQAIIPGQTSKSGDVTPPEIIFLALVKDPLNSDQKLLSFSVRDSGSGVRDIRYRSRSFILSSSLAPAINPVALTNDVWAVSLEIEDNAGNRAEKTVYDWPAFFKGPFTILASFLLVIFAIIAYLIKRDVQSAILK